MAHLDDCHSDRHIYPASNLEATKGEKMSRILFPENPADKTNSKIVQISYDNSVFFIRSQQCPQVLIDC